MSIFGGLDILPVERAVKIGKKTYKMQFNMATLARSEQLYAVEYNRDVNAQKILGELVMAKSSALMAIVYCAMLEGGAVMTWDDFCDTFTSRDFDPLFDAAIECVTQMVKSRDDTDEDADEEPEKN